MAVNPICIEEEMIRSQLHDTFLGNKQGQDDEVFCFGGIYRFTSSVVCYAGSEDAVPGVQLH